VKAAAKKIKQRKEFSVGRK